MGLNDKIANSPFVKKVITMLSGHGLALVIPFFMAPIISRIFSPSEIGSYELFARILALTSVVATFRFELALILPREEKESLGLFHLSIRILFAFFLLSASILIFFYDPIVSLFENEGLYDLLIWLPPAILLTGLLKLLQNYSIRIQRFRLLSSCKVAASAANHGSKALIGAYSPSAIGLLLGHLVGLMAPLAFYFSKNQIRTAFRDALSAPYKGLMKKYRDFPLINSPHILSDEFKNLAIFAMISAGYAEVVLGLFGLTIRYLRVPVELFGNSVGSVFLQSASQSYVEKKTFYPLLSRVIFFLILAGILPFGSLYFFGEELFSWFFGSEWKEAGKYAALISPWLFLSFVVSPVSSVPVIVQRQKSFFVFSVFMNLFILSLASYLAISDYSIAHFILGISIAHSVFQFILLLWLLRISRVVRNE